MPFGAVAGAVASAAITAGVGALTSSGQSGAVSAGQSQANALSQQTIQEGRDNYGRDRATYQPFVDQGTAGVNSLGNILGVNGPDAATAARSAFMASPGYEYQYNQALRGVDAGAASRGMLQSGATIKAEETVAGNLANQDFGNYLTRLGTLGQFGTTGANGQANTTSTFNNLLTGQSSGQQQTDVSAATNQASIYGKQGNALGDGISSALGTAKQNGLFGSGTNATVGTEFSGGGQVPSTFVGFA